MAGEVNPCNFEPTDRHVFDTAEKIGENSQNPWAQISNYTQELSKQALGLTASEPEKTNTLKNWSADASAGLACGLTKHPEFENQLQLYINLLNGTPPDKLEDEVLRMQMEINNNTRAIIPTRRGAFVAEFNRLYQPPAGSDTTIEAVLDTSTGRVELKTRKKPCDCAH